MRRLTLVFLVIAAGCSDDDQVVNDASSSDAPAPIDDAAIAPDGPTPDGPTPDGPLPDAAATCGDNVATGAEACDGPDVGGTTCQSSGFRAGTLRCDVSCQLDLLGCTNVVINEVETNPAPDWVEFYNPGPGAADLSGYTFTDNAPTTAGHTYTFAPGTVIPAGGYLYRLETTDFTFGLGSLDDVRFHEPGGNLVDILSWTSHAVGTLARCPDGGNTIVDVATPTQGSSNNTACP